MKSYATNFDLDTVDKSLATAVWKALADYDCFILETEQKWEERYRFQQLAKCIRKKEIPESKSDKQAFNAYRADAKDSSSKQLMQDPTIAAVKKHIHALVISLIDAWQHSHSLEYIYSTIDHQRSAEEVMQDEVLFLGFEEGSFLNLNRHPMFKSELEMQLTSAWVMEKAKLKSTLLAMTQNDSSSEPSWLVWMHMSHQIAELNQHVIILQWSEHAKILGHNIISCYLDKMVEFLLGFLSELTMTSRCFAEEHFAVASPNRMMVLGQMAGCNQAIHALEMMKRHRSPQLDCSLL